MTSPVPADGGVLVIAEAGVNHNGDPERAYALVAAAAAAGADAVKFQAFQADGLVRPRTAAAAYQQANTGVDDQHALLRSLELPAEVFAGVAEACRHHGITFLCTPFDEGLTAWLLSLGMPWIKVASGELTNAPALRRFGALRVPVILSTGMATLDEVAIALDILDRAGAPEVALLHCTSLYPAPADSVNLRAIPTMAGRFGRAVGYSDHTLGDEIALAAVALGARIVEKHFTLDRGLPGPDHKASLEPDELAALVRRIRTVGMALGDGIKRPAAAELPVADLVRRSWHAAADLPAGTVLEPDMLTLIRPAHGLPPGTELVGRRLVVARTANEPIRAEHLSPVGPAR